MAGGAAVAGLATGGATWAALPGIIGGAGKVIGAMGDQAGQNRAERDVVAGGMNRDYERALMGRADIELAQRQAGDNEAAEAYRQAMRAALATNMQDVTMDRSGFRSDVADVSFMGGGRPSAIGPEGRAAAMSMGARAQKILDDPEPYMRVDPAEKQEPETASFWEKLAGPVGLGLTVWDEARNRTPAQGGTNVSAAPPPPAAPGFPSGANAMRSVRFR